MSLPPPVPPLPQEFTQNDNNNNGRPPVPPVPHELLQHQPSSNNRYDYESPPHFADPLVAPRPHKLDPDLPANMARTLDEQANLAGGGYRPQLQDPYQSVNRGPSPQPPAMNYNSGFSVIRPQQQSSPLPNPQGSSWGPWNPSPLSTPPNQYQASQFPQAPLPPQQRQYSPHPYPSQQQLQPQQYSPQASPRPPPLQQQQPQQYSPQASPRPPPLQQQQQQYQPPPRQQQQQQYIVNSMANLSLNTPQSQPHAARPQSVHPVPAPAPSPPKRASASSSPLNGGLPSLTAPLPTIPILSAAIPSVQQPTHDPALRITWCRDVCFLVDRLQQTSFTTAAAATQAIPTGPARILDPQLLRLSQIAVPIILQIANTAQQGSPMPIHVAEALYLRATFAASGAYPDLMKQNPRNAFRDFELAAKSGYSAAWFRLGRDYESFNDFVHARDCFDRGVKLGVESCCYRMGMAHLLGQLGLPVNFEAALPLLQRAATLASIEVPQPAYIYALLLVSEFAHATIPDALFTPYIPPSSSPSLEARKHLERAAYLSFAPAQYKLGHAYEFAQPPFPFDPLLSVQYYSLASQQGEMEADMALSKWFLCGAAGSFDKDEALAFTFAEKAARRGLPSAEFAMGYYAEVGVGGPKDIEVARNWYTRASEHGNSDAIDRLAALSQPSPQALSRQEHDTITEVKLVRKRTQAQQRSDGHQPPRQQQQAASVNGQQVIDVVRKHSITHPPGSYLQGTTTTLLPPTAAIPGFGAIPERMSSAAATTMNANPNARNHSPNPDPHGSPRLQAASGGGGGGRPFPNTQRYTLTDSPAPLGSGPALGGGVGVGAYSQSVGSGGRPAGRPPASRVQSGVIPLAADQATLTPLVPPADATAPPAPKPVKTGPTTFAEMGIVAAKAEDKECVIM